MANEFKHKDPGSELTQAEFITSDGTGHILTHRLRVTSSTPRQRQPWRV